jgi:two-component system response regulator TctD
MKLLLVEDNLAMQTTLQRTFQRRGMQVVTCDDGNRALDRWRASVPDVVVLDLNLPGQDGLQVLAAARCRGPGRAGADPDRARRGRRPHPRPEHRRRRLPAEAVRSRRARGAHPRAGPPRPAGAAPPEFCGHAGRCRQRRDLLPRRGARPRAARGRAAARAARTTRQRGREGAPHGAGVPGEDQVQAEAIEVVAYRLRKRSRKPAPSSSRLRGLGYLLKAAREVDA